MVSLSGFNLLKLHKEFQYIYKKGKSFHSDSVVLFSLNQNGIHKVGFTATKKIGNAVKRNRAKRRMRALFSEYSASLKDGTYIFVAKEKLYDASHEKLASDFQKVLYRSKSLMKSQNV